MDDDEPDFFGTGGFGSGRGAGRNGGYGSRNSDRSDTGFGYGDAGYSYNAYGPGGSIGGYGSAGYTYGDSKKKKKAPAKKPEKPIALTQGREIAAAGRTGIDYGPGDRVRHIKFGEGTVIEVNEGTRDYEVTVEFDSVGRRTLLAGFAKLIRV